LFAAYYLLDNHLLISVGVDTYKNNRMLFKKIVYTS
jgi:hypothetical protein